MGPRLRLTTALVALLLPCLASASSANLITYTAGNPNRPLVMVMEDTGANQVTVYTGDKFEWTPDVTISPPLADGTSWVAIYSLGDLVKVPSTGGNTELLLCRFGTYGGGIEYSMGFAWPQWSPDGTEILVTTDEFLALIPADHVPGPDCESSLVPIWDIDWAEYKWTIEAMPAWNGDGSRIAFFESFYQPEGDSPWRLTTIRPESDSWTTDVAPSLIPQLEYPVVYLAGLDWQRTGDSLAFAVRDESGRRVTWWLAVIDSRTGAWEYLLDNGNRIEGRNPTWSPNDDYLLFTDGAGNLVKWSYPDGPGEVIGAGSWADWQRDALVLDCNISGCDDGNACTQDSCDTATGQCSHTNLADGTSCGTFAWCEAGVCFDPECGISELPDCDDGNDCTVDTCSSYECLFDTEAALTLPCDDNDDCTIGETCNGSGECTGGVLDETNPACSCLSKGVTCSSDDECCSGSCHPIKGTCK